MYRVIELNDHIENTGQNLQGRVGEDDEELTIDFNGAKFYPTVADLKQIVKFFNRVIREAT